MLRQEQGRKNFTQGKLAEFAALFWLLCKGYRLVGRRITGKRGSGVGEVDLVLRRGRILIFVEVKSRQSYAQALESITNAQRQRIMRGAEQFLKANTQYTDWDCRFDVVAIVPWCFPRHIPNAWGDW